MLHVQRSSPFSSKFVPTKLSLVATPPTLNVPVEPLIAVAPLLVRKSLATLRTTAVSMPFDAKPLSLFAASLFVSVTTQISLMLILLHSETEILAQQLCGPLYSNNSILSSSVASAIASATAVASSAVSGKDLTNPLIYPACAVSLSLPSFCPHHIQSLVF